MTHLAILLANYCASVLNKKTALIEYTDKKAFEEIGRFKQAFRNQKPETEFWLSGVYYCANADEEKLNQMFNDDFSYLILDCGSCLEAVRSVFMRSDRKVVVSSFCEWKRRQSEEKIRELLQADLRKEWRYLLSFGRKRDVKEFWKQFSVNPGLIPYEPDPFSLQKENWKAISQIL